MQPSHVCGFLQCQKAHYLLSLAIPTLNNLNTFPYATLPFVTLWNVTTGSISNMCSQRKQVHLLTILCFKEAPVTQAESSAEPQTLHVQSKYPLFSPILHIKHFLEDRVTHKSTC